ncbi:tail fiber domain-containing protein [Psychroserpens jangbogonensis]|uniref:tail fiber domain-containing protein n=1 Tax=Psychroserpens jangbogonensis TaxID=1484460 RepID=UPI00053DAE02|nr:tail fiber domain-containing protein [Psychroserpens jangbogonensis]
MKSVLYFLFVLFLTFSLHAQVGIGTTSPNGALEITSTTEGLLIPRVVLTATTTITVATPIASELVYNTNTAGDVTPGFYYLSSVTGPWVRLAAGSTGWLTTGNADIVDGTNFLGTTNNIDVAFRRNSAAAGKIGDSNTSYGVGAANTGVGIQNTAFGVNTLLSKTNGSANTAIGWSTLSGLGTYDNVTALGFEAGNSNTASNGTLIGFQAGANNQGDRFLALGFQAGTNNRAANNIAIGTNALDNHLSNASGQNIGIGTNAMGGGSGSGTTVSQNVAIGFGAGQSIQSINNVAVGNNAMLQVTSGQANVAIGSGAMTQGNTGFNTAIGTEALFNASGNNNVAIGYQAARTNAAGSNSVIIGYQANASNLANTVCVGFQATATASNQIQLGNAAISTARVQVGWTITSDRRFKSNIETSELGLDFIKTLRPVSYFRKNADNKKTEYGFIAQELEQALKNAGASNNGIILKDAAGMYGVRYNDFIPMTVKAVQEQQELIEELQKQNAALLKANAAILKRLDALESK